ncbi:MAG: hypothetical protein IKG14_02075 [Clostridia bacterium]|nr:hypothetical protein [Clostridia bacterium]
MNQTVKVNKEKEIIGKSDKQKSKIIEDDDLILLVDDPGFEITEEVIQGIKRGIDDIINGRTMDAEEFFREFEKKYGISHSNS